MIIELVEALVTLGSASKISVHGECMRVEGVVVNESCP